MNESKTAARARSVRTSVSAARMKPEPEGQATELASEDRVRIQMMDGIGATTLRRLIAEQGFPPPIRVSDRILRWSTAEVRAWIRSRQMSAQQYAASVTQEQAADNVLSMPRKRRAA